MKKLYYRCEDIVNEVLEAEAERMHITKNQLIDDVIRSAFDLRKVSKLYQRFTETEQKILNEIILLSAEIIDIYETVTGLQEDTISDGSIKTLLVINANLLQIIQKLKEVESQIQVLTVTARENPNTGNSS